MHTNNTSTYCRTIYGLPTLLQADTKSHHLHITISTAAIRFGPGLLFLLLLLLPLLCLGCT